MKRYCPKVPYLLVGLKTDLRHDEAMLQRMKDENKLMVSADEGDALAKKIKAVSYVECSAKEGTNIKAVFESAARSCLAKKGGCVVL